VRARCVTIAADAYIVSNRAASRAPNLAAIAHLLARRQV
jgi:hypothetical protein